MPATEQVPLANHGYPGPGPFSYPTTTTPTCVYATKAFFFFNFTFFWKNYVIIYGWCFVIADGFPAPYRAAGGNPRQGTPAVAYSNPNSYSTTINQLPQFQSTPQQRTSQKKDRPHALRITHPVTGEEVKPDESNLHSLAAREKKGEIAVCIVWTFR